MSDFVNEFWNWYVILGVLVSILACGVVLWMQSIHHPSHEQTTDTTGHVWDETLEEFNNPLPKWWMWLFYITLVFAAIYLALYPGLGSFSGIYKWTSTGQYDGEQQKAQARFGPVFDKFVKMDLKDVAADPEAREIGQRLFLNTCAQCHASDGRGSKGFPNLTDGD